MFDELRKLRASLERVKVLDVGPQMRLAVLDALDVLQSLDEAMVADVRLNTYMRTLPEIFGSASHEMGVVS